MTTQKFCKAVVDKASLAGGCLKAFATVEVKDREGDIVRVGGVEYDHRPDSPVKVFGTAHKYGSLPDGTHPVMGVVKSFSRTTREVDGKSVPAIAFEMEWAKEESGDITPYAAKLKSLYGGGTLDSFSIGFDPLEVAPLKGGRYDVKRSRIYEISACAIGVNRYATVMKSLKSTLGDDFDSEEHLETRLIELQKAIDGLPNLLKSMTTRFDSIESALAVLSKEAGSTLGHKSQQQADEKIAEVVALLRNAFKS